MSDNINLMLTATDQASSVIADASGKITGNFKQVEEQTRKVSASFIDNVSTANSLALAGATLFLSFERVEKAGLAVEKANLGLKRSTESLDQATKNYNEAIAKYGSGSVEAKDAADRLAIAQDTVALATERANIIQNDFNQSLVYASLSVIPSLIAVGTGVWKIYEQWTIHAKNAAAAQKVLNAETTATSGAGMASGLGAIGAIIGAVIINFTVLNAQQDEMAKKGAETNQVFTIMKAITYGLGETLATWLMPQMNKWLGLIDESDKALKALADAAKANGKSAQEMVNVMAELGYSKEAIDKVAAAITGISKAVIPAVPAVNDLTSAFASLSEKLISNSSIQEASVNKENTRYQDALKGITDYWNTALGLTKTEQQRLIDAVTSTYNKEVNVVSAHYKGLLDMANLYYDGLQDAADAGLNQLKASRDKDLDSAEGVMLTEKVRLEKLYSSGAMDKEQFERKKASLSRKYSDETSAINDSYRLKELSLEASNTVESARIAEERKKALNDLANAEAQEKLEITKRCEQEKLDVAKLYQTQTEQANIAHQENLLAIDVAGGAARVKATADISKLVAEAVETGAKLLIPTTSWNGNPIVATTTWYRESPTTMTGAKAKVMGSGGLVTEPTFALIGEAGPELVIPLNQINKGAGNENTTIQMNSNPQIHIGTLTSNASLQEILSGITKAVASGSADSLVNALSRAEGEKRRRRV